MATQRAIVKLDRLSAKLLAIEKVIEKKVITGADRGLKIGTEYARDRVHVVTGDLRSSIHYTPFMRNAETNQLTGTFYALNYFIPHMIYIDLNLKDALLKPIRTEVRRELNSLKLT